MDVKVVRAKSFKESLELMKRAIKSREIDLERRHFCLVPDDLTLLSERLLFDNSGAFDVEVLTFNRLFSKLVSKTANYLPRYGAIMLLKRVIKACKNELKFFSKSVEFDGFSQKVYDTIASLLSCLITPSDLLAINDSEKIRDIAIIYSHYLDACGDYHIDALGRSRLLSETILSSDLSNTDFYFAAYSDFTKQQRRIIDSLAKTSNSVTIFKPVFEGFSYESVELYEADDVADQLKAAAVRMRQLRMSGVDYNKMGIIAPSLRFEQARRILSEFEIPFNLSERTALSESAAARFLKALYNAATFNYASDEIMTLVKNYFCGIEKSQADIFENYCNRFCIDRSRFCSAFTIPDKENEGVLSVAESIRERIHSLIEGFIKRSQTVRNADDFFEFLQMLFNEIDANKKLKSLINISGHALMSDSIERILETASVLRTIANDREYSSSELFDLLFEGLASIFVSTIPSRLGAVEISSSSGFRAGGAEHLFVIGFCEGEIPPIRFDDNLITETDIDMLNTFDLSLEPKVTKINESSANDFLSSLATAKTVFLAFSNSNEKRSSVLKEEILRDAKCVNEVIFSEERKFLNEFNPSLHEDYFDNIAMLCSSKGNSQELMLRAFSAINQGERTLQFYSELCNALNDDDSEKFKIAARNSSVFLTKPNGFFFKKGTTSVSQIQNYFLCPYSHFLSYGLGLKEKPDGKLSALDIGEIMHKAVEIFVSNGRFDAPSHDMRSIIDKTIASYDKTLLEANKAVTERIVFEAVEIASVIASQQLIGSFNSLYQEKQFDASKNDALKTVFLKLNGREISLKGTIDRVDTYNDFARVIDYKSGSKLSSSLSFNDLYFGKKIQLFVYMKILRANGYKSGGMFYFPLAVSWSDDDYSRRLNGIFNNAENVLAAYDRNLFLPQYKSTVINARSLKSSSKDGLVIGKSANAFSENELDLLSDYSLCVMQNAASEIDEGYIASSPLGDCCSYCKFNSICKNNCYNVQERRERSVSGSDIVGIMNQINGEERYGK